MALNFFQQLDRWLNPWRRRILLMIGKAIILSVKDNDNLQVAKLQLMADEETGPSVERLGEYGFKSVPPPDSEAVAVAVGGDRSNMIIIATDYSDKRPKNWESGESGLWNDQGLLIRLRKDGKLGIKTVTYDTNFQKFMDLFLSHKHLGNNGVDTSSPAGSATNSITAADLKGDDN